MIRKILNSVLVFVLLVTTTGLTYHYHYCCNTLIKFSILHTPKPCCEHPVDCCHDQAVNLQLKSDYVFPADLPDLTVPCFEVPVATPDPEEIQYVEAGLPKFPEESPPPPVGLRLALLQQFLI